MSKQEEVRKLLKKMASEVGPAVSLLAEVKSVDETELTCVLTDDDGLEFFDVRLTPVVDGNVSFTIIPKINTWALAVRMEDSDDWLVLSVGEAQKVLLKCDEVVINDGSKGGLVNWPDTKTQLDKNNAVVQALVNAVTNWTPVPNDGGSALKTLMTAQLAGKTLGSYEDLEDTKVKH